MSSARETRLGQLAIDKAGWAPVQFGDIAFETKELVKDALEEGIEHVVGLEHIETEDIHLRHSRSIEESTTFRKKFSPGDVLFGRRRAYLKKAARAEFAGICSGDIIVMRANPDKLLPELLPFVVNNEKFFDWAITHSAGGLSPRCKFKDLANYEFLLPPKSQQAELAELLWAMDDVVQKAHKGLSKLSILIDSYRSYAFRSGRWSTTKLGDQFEVQLGKMLSSKSKSGESPYSYLTNKNVQWGHIILDELNVMDFNEKERSKFSLQDGDLLVCEGGEVGRAAIWREQKEDCFYQKALHRLRSKNSRYLPEVMLEVMKWAQLNGILKGLTGHTTIAHLTAVTLRGMKIPLIPIEDQTLIRGEFQSLYTAKKGVEKQLENSCLLQKSLVNQVF